MNTTVIVTAFAAAALLIYCISRWSIWYDGCPFYKRQPSFMSLLRDVFFAKRIK